MGLAATGGEGVGGTNVEHEAGDEGCGEAGGMLLFKIV